MQVIQKNAPFQFKEGRQEGTIAQARMDGLLNVPWAVEGLFPKVGLAFAFGLPSSMKSTLTLDLAFDLATGKSTFNDDMTQRSRVLYLDLDAGGSLFSNKILKNALGKRLTDEEADDFRYASIPPLNLKETGDLYRLQTLIQQHQAKVLVLDHFTNIMGGDDGNNAKCSDMMHRLRQLSDTFQLLIVILDHTTKSGSVQKGSGVKRALADIVLKVTKVADGHSPISEVEVIKNKCYPDGPYPEGHAFQFQLISKGCPSVIAQDGSPIQGYHLEAYEEIKLADSIVQYVSHLKDVPRRQVQDAFRSAKYGEKRIDATLAQIVEEGRVTKRKKKVKGDDETRGGLSDVYNVKR